MLLSHVFNLRGRILTTIAVYIMQLKIYHAVVEDYDILFNVNRVTKKNSSVGQSDNWQDKNLMKRGSAS